MRYSCLAVPINQNRLSPFGPDEWTTMDVRIPLNEEWADRAVYTFLMNPDAALTDIIDSLFYFVMDHPDDHWRVRYDLRQWVGEKLHAIVYGY